MKKNYTLDQLIKLSLGLLGIFLTGPGFSQKNKSPFLLAEEFFAKGEYYTAAHLYEQHLAPSNKKKGNTEFPLNIKARRSETPGGDMARQVIMYKMAESYRLAHYWKEAAATYKTCAETDPENYPDAWYWYAVCQRSLGQYDSASKYLQTYTSTRSSQKKMGNEAKSEIATLKFIKQQNARPDSVLFKVKKLESAGSFENGLYAMGVLSNGQAIMSSTVSDSSLGAGINPNRSALFTASMQGTNLGALTPLALPMGEPGWNTGAASTSVDGQTIYFTQWKKVNGITVSKILVSQKSGDTWGAPVSDPILNSEGSNNKQPFLSRDGRYLFFASDRKGGRGGFDIWYCPITNGKPGKAVNLGNSINTPGNEVAPFYQSSGRTLVFASDGKPGMGGYDLFSSEGAEKTWTPAENLGHPVNSSRDDIYFFTGEKNALLAEAWVGSDRGEGCCLETFQVTKSPKKQVVTGILYDTKTGEPLGDARVVLQVNGSTVATVQSAPDGQYTLDLGSTPLSSISIRVDKQDYRDTMVNVLGSSSDRKDYLVDKLRMPDQGLTPVEPTPPLPPATDSLSQNNDNVIMEGDKEVLTDYRAEDVVTVYFYFDRYYVRADAMEKLDSIYQIMIEEPEVTIQIAAYTDGIGTDKYNDRLSDRRARACADYMIRKGIARERIKFVSFGACCPVEMEKINGRDNPLGRKMNRRALINIKRPG